MTTGPKSPGFATEPLERLYWHMARTWFIAGRSELIDAGFSPTELQSWLLRSRLVQVLRGVYSFGRDVETREAALRAALVAAGAGAALTGRTACEQWGMVETRRRVPRRIDVAVPRGQARWLEGQSPSLRGTKVRAVSRSFGPGDIRRLDDFDVTSPVAALVDFAVDATEREVRFAFLEGCRLKLIKRPEVSACYRKVYGRRGAKKLRPLLGLWVPELNQVKSVFEGRVLLDLVDRDYALPAVNTKVEGWEVDMHWPDLEYILELDGGTYHGDPAQHSIDAEKQRTLEAAGKTVRRLTYEEYDADPVAALDSIGRDLGFLEDS